jgi:peptidoglycan/xylan/chitin deacetylase (PgdA/CDA1 family)
MGVSTDQFFKEVKYLKKHYKIASLPEAIQMLREGKVPAPTVVLTFDDGYEDNYLGMRAVIESEEVPVTLFVCTRNVEEHRAFDHDLGRGESDFFPLTWDQLKEFERHGTVVGSHTRTHFDCGSFDEEVLREEIAGSRKDLQQRLGHDVPYFSFPWGCPKNMSSAALAIASECYPYLFAAYGGANEARDRAPVLFKRVSWPESLLELELSLQGILDFHMGAVFCPPAIGLRPGPANGRPQVEGEYPVPGIRTT